MAPARLLAVLAVLLLAAPVAGACHIAFGSRHVGVVVGPEGPVLAGLRLDDTCEGPTFARLQYPSGTFGPPEPVDLEIAVLHGLAWPCLPTTCFGVIVAAVFHVRNPALGIDLQGVYANAAHTEMHFVLLGTYHGAPAVFESRYGLAS